MNPTIPFHIKYFADTFETAANIFKKNQKEKVQVQIQEAKGALLEKLEKSSLEIATKLEKADLSRRSIALQDLILENGDRIFNIFYRTFNGKDLNKFCSFFYDLDKKKNLELMRFSNFQNEREDFSGLSAAARCFKVDTGGMFRIKDDKPYRKEASEEYKKACFALYSMSAEQFCNRFQEESKKRGFPSSFTFEHIKQRPKWLDSKLKQLEALNQTKENKECNASFPTAQVFAIGEEENGKRPLYVNCNEDIDFSHAFQYIAVKDQDKLWAWQECRTPFTFEKLVYLNKPSRIDELPVGFHFNESSEEVQPMSENTHWCALV